MSLLKFNRKYKLQFTTDAETVTITDPIRIQFDGTRSTSGFGVNKINGKIFGLNETHRNYFQKNAEEQKFLRINLSVGYGNNLVKIFTGDLHIGSNQLTNNGFETSFECFDGGYDYLNSYTAKTVKGKSQAIKAVLDDMPNTNTGAITDFKDLTRYKVLMGPSSKLLEDMADKETTFFIDDSKCIFLNENDVLKDTITTISPDTGLISTPVKEFMRISFECMLNVNVVPGSRIKLISSVVPSYNGIYKIDTINYTGDLEGLPWKQTMHGFLLTSEPTVLK